MSLKYTTVAIVLAVALTLPALAQETMDHGTMDHGAMGAMAGKPKGDDGPSSQAFSRANAAMHTAMDLSFTGNADIDFARGMIAHHQGAIDMAKVELAYGTDDALRKLASEVIAAQEAEIKVMKDWLARNGG